MITTTFPLLLLLSSFLATVTLSTTTTPSNSPVTPDKACSLTLYPSFCKSILSSQPPQPLSTFILVSTSKSLMTTHDHLAALTSFRQKNRPLLSHIAVVAIEDCMSLSDLNINFFTSVNSTLASATSLSEFETENVHTLLSSTLTNMQTCVDGLFVLNDAVINDGIYGHLSNGTMVHSIALGLFAHAWVPNSKQHSRQLRVDGHKLLQAPTTGLVISDMVVVSQDGSGNFTNITAAVNSAPINSDGSGGYYMIYIKAGVYQEYVTVPVNNQYLMMVGDGINQTIITGNHSVADNWTTYSSATFAVVAQGFVAMNITFQNTAGAINQQAVAVLNGADLSVFYNCSIEGYQDTLYAHSMRHFYRECDIYGTVDFIFGNAATVLQNCNIYARLPVPGQSDPITAQGRTDPSQNTGTSIHNCSILQGPDLAADNGTTQVYLGRPWKLYSTTVYLQSFLDSLINPAGWLEWSGDFALSTLYYAEYNNTGPGSNTSSRVTWPGYHVLYNSSDADVFTVSNFLLGDLWLPQTGVPYFGGLM